MKNLKSFVQISVFWSLCGWSALLALDPRVESVVSAEKGLSYGERFEAIHRLGDNVHPASVEVLLDFLQKPLAQSALKEDQLGSLKNDVTDKLLAQKRLPERLPAILIAGIDDEVQGRVWNEYCIQKLPELSLRVENAKERAAVIDKLWHEARNTHYIHSGTALLGLERLHAKRPDWVARDEVVARGVAILKDEHYSVPNKMSALQVLARLEHEAVDELARSILNGESEIMLKVSALATLGMVGNDSDLELIGSYAKSPEYRLRTAARAALDKLK